LRPTAVTIRGLRVNRTSDALGLNRPPALPRDALGLNRPPTLPRGKKPVSDFHIGSVGHLEERGVSSRPGKVGNIGYIRRPLRPGRYEAVVKVERLRG